MLNDINKEIDLLLETEKTNILTTLSKINGPSGSQNKSKAFNFVSMKDLQRGVDSEAQAKNFAGLLIKRINSIIQDIIAEKKT